MRLVEVGPCVKACLGTHRYQEKENGTLDYNKQEHTVHNISNQGQYL